MGSKSSSPPSPDYTGAAVATAKSGQVNYNTPYGGIQYSDGADGHTNANVTLSPDQQRLLDQQNKTSASLGGLQDQATARVASTESQPFDMGAVPQMTVQPGQTGQDAMMARLQPQFDRDQNSLNTRLANQGITQGSEAWNNAQDQFGRTKNDAYSQAALSGINLDTQAHQQGMTDQSYLRSQPLNELNALRSGSQVTSPNFQSMPQVQGTNYTGAAVNGYNANLNASNASNGANNSMMNGLFGLGGTAISSYFSDRRLKRNIKRIGKRADGLSVYSYTYVWGEPSFGLMADEVKALYPHAVTRQPNGYDAVDYGALK